MTLKQLERLLAGESVIVKNGRIFLDGDWFVIEKKIELNGDIVFDTIGGYKDLEDALKRLGG